MNTSVTVPLRTVLDFGEIVAHLLHTTWGLVESLFRGLNNWTDPPSDLEIRSRDGWMYTGFFIVEENAIVWGAVVRVARQATRPHQHYPQRPWSSDGEGLSQLGDWTNDARDEGEPPWVQR